MSTASTQPSAPRLAQPSARIVQNSFLETPVASLPSPANQTAQQRFKLAQRLAATCASCHGTDGISVSHALPRLAGLPQTYIAQQLRDFKSGARPSTVMQQLAQGYSEAQIDLIAEYFAGQPAP